MNTNQCTVWPCNALATCPSSLHSKGRQRYLGFRPLPTSAATLAPHPRLAFQHQSQIRNHQIASLQRRWSYAMLCSASTCNQHPRTIPNPGLATIVWWKGKHAPRASALRAPWALSLSPNLAKSLQCFLRQWHLRTCWNTMFHAMYHHSRPCSSNMHRSWTFCATKSAIESWSTGTTPTCCCQSWHTFKHAALNPDSAHWVLSGSLHASTGEIPSEQGLPSQTRFHSESATGHSQLVQVQWPPFHTKSPSSGSWSVTLVHSQRPRHSAYHLFFHPTTRIPLSGRSFPL